MSKGQLTLTTDGSHETESGQVRILPIASVLPSPENEELYRPIDSNDPLLLELAESIRVNGFTVPMVVARDYPGTDVPRYYYILSGHRRYAAAELIGLENVPCTVLDIYRWVDGPDGWELNSEFIRKLEMYNRQRHKTLDEMMRESVIKADPKDAYRALSEYREKRADEFYGNARTIELRSGKRRARISRAKLPFAHAVVNVLNENRDYLPLSDRQIFYALLSDPPLRHASKPDSRFNNKPNDGKRCYKDLTDLLTRMRILGHIPFGWIDDQTRPVAIARCYQDAGLFLGEETAGLFKGYYRDLMQSQPNHIEILYEKLTGYNFIRNIALNYCIPLTVGRGFSSVPPRYKIGERYRKSGKDKLIVLAMTDLDPDGDEIAHSFARSMRDDFGITKVELVKVALTMEQAVERKLPISFEKAKEKSTNYKRYVQRYRTDNVWELEALSPAVQQALLRDAIDSVIDVDAYNQEVEQEEKEAGYLDEQRQRALLAMGDIS